MMADEGSGRVRSTLTPHLGPTVIIVGELIVASTDDDDDNATFDVFNDPAARRFVCRRPTTAVLTLLSLKRRGSPGRTTAQYILISYHHYIQ